MNSVRLVAWSPVILLALLGALTAWLDRAVQSGGALGPRSLAVPDIIVEGMSAIKYNANGTPLHGLIAKRLEHQPDKDSTQLDYPVLTHFDPDKAQVEVRANHAQVSKDAKVVTFTGGVQIVRAADDESGPVTLKTEYLRMLLDEEIARSDQMVEITGDHGVLSGVGLEFNNRTRQMKLNSRVRGQFKNPRSP
ncbi:MAG: LPS export ABC transporter periplasmic protein LptC [Betaproteobacteria bacterium]|nr:LPS export ABC transporter periplasmic protein LptC [Betaproteobacteria bacterium]